MSKAVMQQALDALKTCDWDYDYDENAYQTFDNDLVNDAVDALEAELAKPKNEFNPDWHTLQPYHDRIAELEAQLALDKKADNARELGLDYEPEQEPVAWVDTNDQVCALLKQAHDVLAIASLPPKREWVGLTDDEIDWIFGLAYADDMELLKTIEAKLREKNEST